MVFPTQPLQVTMRHQQKAVNSQAQLHGLVATARRLYQQDGFRALMRGSLPAAAKEVIKNGTYKAPLIKGAPGIVEEQGIVPHALTPLAAGIFAGAADTLFGGALERYATLKATSSGDTPQAKIMVRGMRPVEIVQSMYKGAGAATTKNSVAFTTFFYSSEPAKKFSKDLCGDNVPQWYQQLTAALISGGAVALTSSPFDIAKTISQMPNPSKDPTLTILQKNFALHGVKGMCAGVGTKALMVALGWSINKIYVDNMPSPRL